MADPITIDCASACTVTVVHELVFPPFNLTLEEAGQLALAIIGVWIVGWAVRMVMKTMRSAGGGDDHGEVS